MVVGEIWKILMLDLSKSKLLSVWVTDFEQIDSSEIQFSSAHSWNTALVCRNQEIKFLEILWKNVWKSLNVLFEKLSKTQK